MKCETVTKLSARTTSHVNGRMGTRPVKTAHERLHSMSTTGRNMPTTGTSGFRSAGTEATESFAPTQNADLYSVLIEPTAPYTDTEIQMEIQLPEDEWIERMLS